MILPMQSKDVRRSTPETHAFKTDFAINAQVFLRQTAAGPRFPEDPACYSRCRGNGVDDLTCRFFCGLPPISIGDLVVAR
jgi:hypothetical protein